MQCRPPTSPLFPYTTLFRSGLAARRVQAAREHGVGTGREEIVLVARGEVTEPLVVDRPQRVAPRSEEHTSELQSLRHLVCRLLLEKKKKTPHEAESAHAQQN